MDDREQSEADDGIAAPQAKALPPAARRALEEAAQRRAARRAGPRATEINGRDGPDPVRYGDWEVRGLVTDF